MKRLVCVAIDDEPVALEIITLFCQRRGDIDLHTFTDAAEGVEYINKVMPSIVFLDIEMNGANGLQIARKLPYGVNVIFTTAYMEFALEGFNLDAADFLHKPFSYERFGEAIEKASRRIKYNDFITSRQQIIVKQTYNNIPVAINDILYIEAMENYSKIFLRQGRMVLAHHSLKSLLELLPASDFVRIHKSYIIARREIKSFTKQNVILNEGTELPVGRQFSNGLF